MGIFLAVLGGYVWTLAPTVTFWDAGEFIASAKILGIPHPPGTPLFVLMAHVWAGVMRLGEFAWRTNLLAAVCSAGAATWFFLLVVRTLPAGDPIFRFGGAAAAAMLSAFVFTVWQNSNETEVYMVATFSIAAICWLAFLWREARGTSRAPHILLLCVYLGAVSLGNHLLTLLVGPALIGFMWHVQRTAPLENPDDARAEWAQWAVVAGVWALLIGSGLGSTPLLAFGGVVFLAAAVYAMMAGAFGFAAAVLAIGTMGASTYLFLYIRAGLHPFINEADPSTWESLKAVIRREQYPVRSPFDNPLQVHGQGNTGRTFELLWWQVINYLQYFDWQWANGLAPTQPVFAPVRLPFTLAFASLGIYGGTVLRRYDRSVYWLLLLLFVTTGPALLGYMNFKPGASLLWDVYRDASMHEVRERDYFFTVSYEVWGLFAGIGLAGLYRLMRERAGDAARVAPVVLAGAFLPFVLNFRAASRAHGPDARLPSDFAYDMLQSVEPYGILFTNGDNDTFPLWYIQETEGFRQDVTVVNLSLANTDWFVKQLRDNPVRAFQPAQAPWYAHLAPREAPAPLHSLTDAELKALEPQYLSRDYTFRVGRVEHTYKQGTPFYVKDVMVLRLIQENYRRRPIFFSTTAGSDTWLGLGDYLTQEAMVLRLNVTTPADTSRLGPSVFGVPLDVPRTDSLAWSIYRYAGLMEADTVDIDPTGSNIATNLSLPFLALGQVYEARNERIKALTNLRRAYHLSPSRELLAAIRQLGTVGRTDTAAK